MSYPESICQEEFSKAFLHALAAVSGCGMDSLTPDYDSIDALIHTNITGAIISSPRLEIQLKCQKISESKIADYIPYALPIKNYDDLRKPSALPRLLVVVQVPEEITDWIVCHPTHMLMNYNAHWLSLKNAEQSDNQYSVTVHVPRQNIFNAETLRGLLQDIADGREP